MDVWDFCSFLVFAHPPAHHPDQTYDAPLENDIAIASFSSFFLHPGVRSDFVILVRLAVVALYW